MSSNEESQGKIVTQPPQTPTVEPAQLPEKEEKRALEQKWTKTLIQPGYTAIPSVIVQQMGVLGLTPLDLAILMQILSYWWKVDNPPSPSIKTIAGGIGVSQSTVKRRIKMMVAARFLKRTERRLADARNKTNVYEFGPLIEAATPYAEAKLEQIAEYKEKKQKLLTKKGKPGSKV
jgi:DNA-binding MarR family transcriptional regulator